MGARDENNGSGEITGITFDGKVKYFKHRGRVFLIKGGGSIDVFQLSGKWLLVGRKMQKDLLEFVNLDYRAISISWNDAWRNEFVRGKERGKKKEKTERFMS